MANGEEQRPRNRRTCASLFLLVGMEKEKYRSFKLGFQAQTEEKSNASTIINQTFLFRS